MENHDQTNQERQVLRHHALDYNVSAFHFAFRIGFYQLLLGVVVSLFLGLIGSVQVAYSFFSGLVIFTISYCWVALRLNKAMNLAPQDWLKRFYWLTFLKSIIIVFSFIILAFMDNILIMYVFFGYLLAFLIKFVILFIKNR